MAATTFSELWDELKADAAAAWQKVKDEAATIEHNIVPVIEADIVAVLSQFKQLAIDTIMSLATAEFNNLSGREKQGQVITTVLQAAEAKGLAVGLADVQSFAQQAYTAVATTLKPTM